MDTNSSTKSQSIPKSLPKHKPKITFVRLLAGLFTVVCVAAVVFWFYNIRQPGVSYQPPEQNQSTTVQTSLTLQTPTGVSLSNQVEDTTPAKPLTTEAALKKHIEHLATTIGERNLRTYQKLCDAADFIEAEYKSYGYKPARQTYQRQWDSGNACAGQALRQVCS